MMNEGRRRIVARTRVRQVDPISGPRGREDATIRGQTCPAPSWERVCVCLHGQDPWNGISLATLYWSWPWLLQVSLLCCRFCYRFEWRMLTVAGINMIGSDEDGNKGQRTLLRRYTKRLNYDSSGMINLITV